jgi:rhodanese-related sulfurtransferase
MKKVVLFFAALFCTVLSIQAQNSDKNIEAKSFIELVNTDSKLKIIDVRTADEVAQGKIDQAVNINVFSVDFEADVAKQFPNKEEQIYLYCRSGKRSENAIKKLEVLGYTNLINVNGGYIAIEKVK